MKDRACGKINIKTHKTEIVGASALNSMSSLKPSTQSSVNSAEEGQTDYKSHWK